MEKLIEIQKKLVAPKSQYNSFGKYKYRSCEDILEAVKPLLGEAVLTLTDEIVLVGDRYYVKATATIKEGVASHSVSAFAREAEDKKGMDSGQVTGATSSYARKYALNGLFLIDDSKDSDKTNDKNEVDIEKVKSELAEIKDIPTLRAFYDKNKGLGKEVAELITQRSEEIKN